MKKILLLIAFTSTICKAQTSCNQSTFSPSTTFTTGAVVNHPGQSTEMLYLCQNATIIDTSMNNISCRWTIVNTGAKLTYKAKNCSSYIYALGNSTIIIAANSSGQSPTIVREAGVTVTNNSTLTVNTVTCASISTPTNINCGVPTRISNNGNLEESFRLYPNPASEIINVELASSFSAGKTEISIFNQLGQKVYDGGTVVQKTTIDTRELNNGIYFLRINSGKNSAVRKIVIEK